jgi:hypothetical protein
MYTYWQIFKQALKIAYKNPSLWFFALFTTFLGSAGGLELLLSGYGFGGQSLIFSFWQGLLEGGLFTPSGLRSAAKILLANPFYLITIAIIFLVVLGITILFIWLGTVSQTALIGKSMSITRNKNISFSDGFRWGVLKFWPVLALNAISQFIVWLLFFILSSLFLINPSNSLVVTMFIVDLVVTTVFFTILLVISFIAKYAICGVVLRNWAFKDSVKASWEIFLKNWLVAVELAAILFFINLVVNSVLTFVMSLIFLYILKLYFGFTFGLALVFLILVSIFAIIQLMLVIFHWAAWAIAFEILAAKKNALLSITQRIFRFKSA